MTPPTPIELSTRDQILKLLSDGEIAGMRTAATKARLGRGDEYLDLEQLHRGVQRADGAAMGLGYVLPRKVIHEDTWRRILRQLKAAQLQREP